MPRGYPDYQSSREQAIALQTMWMDDFEAPGLKWTPASAVGGTDPVLSTVQAWKGLQSVFFTTAAVAGEWARIERYFPLLRRGKVGIEFFIYFDIVTDGFFNLHQQIYDGENISVASLLLDNEARTATIVTPAGPVVVATECFPELRATTWVPVKLVVDIVTDLYTRLIIGTEDIDLSDYELVPGVVTTNRLIRVRNTLQGGWVGAMTAYMDDFILTQNEP